MKTTMTNLLLGSLLVALTSLPALADSPTLTVWGTPGFGNWTFNGPDPTPVELVLISDDPDGIAFNWVGDASAYDGTLDGYRMGWDLNDPEDPNDPGWIHPGFGPWQESEPRVFNNGFHAFTVEVQDTAGAMTRAVFWVHVRVSVDVERLPLGEMKSFFR